VRSESPTPICKILYYPVILKIYFKSTAQHRHRLKRYSLVVTRSLSGFLEILHVFNHGTIRIYFDRSTAVVTWLMEREPTFIRMVGAARSGARSGRSRSGSGNSCDWSERRSGKMSAPALRSHTPEVRYRAAASANLSAISASGCRHSVLSVLPLSYLSVADAGF